MCGIIQTEVFKTSGSITLGIDLGFFRVAFPWNLRNLLWFVWRVKFEVCILALYVISFGQMDIFDLQLFGRSLNIKMLKRPCFHRSAS